MKNKAAFFTRKNFIAIALAFFYAIIIVFTGLCIDANHSFVSKKNILNQFANTLNFAQIHAGVSGFLCLILVAIYVIVFVTAFIFEMRLAIVTKKKPFSLKMIFIYLATLISRSSSSSAN